MAQKDIKVAYGVDVDAVAGWLGSYGGEDSPDDISRGLFAGEVGTPRLLKLFNAHNIRATWFIPGHSIETFPEQTRLVADAGHEIGAHGYSHENPIAMTPQQEADVLRKSIDLIAQVAGRTPAGYVVTIVFVDLVNSTAMKAALTGSDIMARNRAYFDTILTPQGNYVIWGDTQTTDSYYVIWGDSTTAQDPQ